MVKPKTWYRAISREAVVIHRHSTENLFWRTSQDPKENFIGRFDLGLGMVDFLEVLWGFSEAHLVPSQTSKVELLVKIDFG